MRKVVQIKILLNMTKKNTLTFFMTTLRFCKGGIICVIHVPKNQRVNTRVSLSSNTDKGRVDTRVTANCVK